MNKIRSIADNREDSGISISGQGMDRAVEKRMPRSRLIGFGVAGVAAVVEMACSIVTAALLHGLYDFLLLAWQATFWTSGMVLILWLFVIQRARRLVRARRQATLEVKALTGKFAPV